VNRHENRGRRSVATGAGFRSWRRVVKGGKLQWPVAFAPVLASDLVETRIRQKAPAAGWFRSSSGPTNPERHCARKRKV